MTENKKKAQMIGMLFAGVLTAALLLTVLVYAWLRDTEAEPYRLVFVTKAMDYDNDFWKSMIDGVEMGAEEAGAEVEIMGAESEDDLETQNELILSCIESRPDALLVTPGDYSRTTDALRQVKESGVKVVLLDSLIDEQIADAEVATDNYLAGQELGEYTAGLLDADSVVGIISHVKGTSTAVDREKGIRDGLGTYESQVKKVVYCNSSYDLAYDLTVDMLEEYPDMNVLIGTNEYGAVGAARAVLDLGLQDQIRMVGFDSSIEQIQYLEAGLFEAIIIQKPFNMGYMGVEQAVAILQNREIEYNLNSGSKLITKDNLYEEENQRLLYPFSD